MISNEEYMSSRQGYLGFSLSFGVGLVVVPPSWFGRRHEPVIIRPARIALLLIIIGEQAMGWAMAWLGSKDLRGPLQSFLLMAVLEHPFGHLETDGRVVRVAEQVRSEL